MTDTALTSPSNDLHAPRRRQSATAVTPSTINKRSPSPRVSFTPSQPPSEKGVKNITRKVIRTLEGLGHPEDLDMSEQDELEDREEHQVEESLGLSPEGNGTANGRGTSPTDFTVTNGSASALDAKKSRNSAKKIDWEIPRKVFHSSIGFVTVYLYVSQSSPKIIVLCLWTALAVIAPADYFRLRYPAFERFYERGVGFLMRESERHSTNGVIWYILGVNFALTFYPLDVATVAILILSWADTAASTIGRLWGSYTPPLPRYTPLIPLPLAPRKSLAGFIAASVTGACIAMGFWGWLAPVRNNPADITWWWDTGVQSSKTLLPALGVSGSGLAGLPGWIGLGLIGIVSGLVSGVAEALDLGKLDDNLTLPIISGGVILGFFKLLGFLSNA